MIEGHLTFQSENLAFGFKIKLDESKHTQMSIYKTFSHNRPYEPEVASVLGHKLKWGSTFFDVGAHVGYFTLMGRSIVGNNGLVVSFEPDKDNYKHLTEHVAMNEYENVKTYPLCVSDEVKRMKFYLNLDNDGGHAVWDCKLHSFNEKTRQQSKTRIVQSTTIDTIVEDLGVDRIDLMKVDTEGCELLVLMGARKTIERGILKNVVCEVHSMGLELLGGSVGALFAFMQESGYRSTILFDGEPPEGIIYNVLFERNGLD